MPPLQISLTDETRLVRYDRRKLLRLVRSLLARRMPNAIVDIAVVGARRIATLNGRFLGHRGTTDVIAFNLGPDERGRPLCQLVVCAEVARREARKRGIRSEDELALYAAHGALHLLGETDAAARPRERMRRLAAKALIRAGYRDITTEGEKGVGRVAPGSRLPFGARLALRNWRA